MIRPLTCWNNPVFCALSTAASGTTHLTHQRWQRSRPPFFRPQNPNARPHPKRNEPQDVAQPVERQLKTLRNSPGFRLIADSALFLKACQLDMDFPPTRQDYVRQQLITLLLQKSGKALDPDALQITFSSEDRPLWTITATNATASACR